MSRQQRRRQNKSRRRVRKRESGVAALLRQAAECLQNGRLEDGLNACRQALAAEPDNPDALNLGGMAVYQLGGGEEAVRLLERAVELRPDFVDAHNNLGNLHKGLGRLDAAEAAYRRALGIDSDNVGARYNLGIALEALGRFDEAEDAYRRALTIDGGFAEAHFNLGNVLKGFGRYDEAQGAYKQALRLKPGFSEAHCNLGTVLQEMGQGEDAVGAYRRALKLAPNHIEARYNLGTALHQAGRSDDAVAAYQAVVAAAPEHVGALVNLGYAHKEKGRFEEAEAAYRRAIAVEPGYHKVHSNLGDLMLEKGDAGAALEVCDAYLEAYPGNSGMLAFKSIVLGEIGDQRSLGDLVDFDRFLRPTRFAAAQGFAAIADFNAALESHILDHPTLVYAPNSHATRLGRHSGELLVAPKGPVAVLEQMIEGAVAAYQDALPADESHPFPAARPRRWRLNAWAVVLDRQGHQVAHIHPTAWLSGVYYVRVPGAIAGDQGPAGCIEFGRPAEDFHCTVEHAVRALRPEEGLMVLFPSYFYHRTVPFESAEHLMSIAFDVIAEGEG